MGKVYAKKCEGCLYEYVYSSSARDRLCKQQQYPGRAVACIFMLCVGPYQKIGVVLVRWHTIMPTAVFITRTINIKQYDFVFAVANNERFQNDFGCIFVRYFSIVVLLYFFR